MAALKFSGFKLSDLPRWIPLAAAVLSVIITIVGVTITFAFVAGSFVVAGEPVEVGDLEARYETIDEEGLSRLAPRLSVPTD